MVLLLIALLAAGVGIWYYVNHAKPEETAAPPTSGTVVDDTSTQEKEPNGN